MRRVQIRLDEDTYQALKQEAHRRGLSMSALLRQLVDEHLAPGRRRLRYGDFTFIGSGESEPSDLDPISERHDEVLAEGSRNSW